MASRIHAYPQKSGWLAAWPDPNGQRRRKAGFATEDDALAYAVDAARGIGIDLPAASHRPASVDDLLDLFLDRHGSMVDPATKRKLASQLKPARAAFGERAPDSLARLEIEDWRQGVSAGRRHDVFRAFRQAVTWAHTRGLTETDPTAGIRNPKRKRHERGEIIPLESWDEAEAISGELLPCYAAIPIFGTGTGMRPEEWIALERSDLDRDARLVRVCKRFSDGELKQGTKTVPERFVPLRARVLAALDAMPPRIDTKLLFPAPRGGYINLENFRRREWSPALKAAGSAGRGPNAMRHTFATWAIEEGSIPLPQIATVMGTSIRELESTYHRWLRRTDERLLAALDAYDEAVSA